MEEQMCGEKTKARYDLFSIVTKDSSLLQSYQSREIAQRVLDGACN